MATNKYKVYPASSYDSIDKSKIEPEVRWNLAGTEFIVEFAVEPHGNTVTLNREEARQLMTTSEWVESLDE